MLAPRALHSHEVRATVHAGSIADSPASFVRP